MNLFDIPGLGGYKTLISGYGLLILGLVGLGESVGHCLTGDLSVTACLAAVQASIPPLVTAFGGLGILGIGHRAQKIEEAVKQTNL